jgi:hypothetical protein
MGLGSHVVPFQEFQTQFCLPVSSPMPPISALAPVYHRDSSAMQYVELNTILILCHPKLLLRYSPHFSFTYFAGLSISETLVFLLERKTYFRCLKNNWQNPPLCLYFWYLCKINWMLK